MSLFKKLGAFAVVLLLLIFLLIIITPFDKLILKALTRNISHQTPQELASLDGIVAISPFGEENDDGVFVINERFKLSIKIHQEYPNKKIIFGGACPSYPNCKYRNKERVVRYFVENNISIENIYFETESKTTNENAKFISKLYPEVKDGKWGLVTSDYHMARALMSFSKYGGELNPIPAKSKINKWLMLKLEWHELVGFVYYKYFLPE